MPSPYLNVSDFFQKCLLRLVCLDLEPHCGRSSGPVSLHFPVPVTPSFLFLFLQLWFARETGSFVMWSRWIASLWFNLTCSSVSCVSCERADLDPVSFFLSRNPSDVGPNIRSWGHVCWSWYWNVRIDHRAKIVEASCLPQSQKEQEANLGIMQPHTSLPTFCLTALASIDNCYCIKDTQCLFSTFISLHLLSGILL